MPNPYDANANPTFESALVAYWLTTPGLVQVSPSPYADEGPDKVNDSASYVVMTEISNRDVGMGTRAQAYWEEIVYQFAVYHLDKTKAILQGNAMKDLLDRIHDTPLKFANGRQMSWFHQGSRRLKVPNGLTGAKVIWQQTHLYMAKVGRRRGGA